MAPTGYTRLSVTEQPQAELSMNFSTEKLAEKISGPGHHHEADATHEHDCQQCEESAGHRRCHNGRLRRFLLPIIAAFVLLGSLMAVGCMLGHGSEWGLEGLVSRAVDNTTNGNNSPFVRNKLYLIVVFVGLVIVLILGVMLSAWCCRGAFENPCCCPCYLCACCGGLACLECIGCGLCAEGIDQM